MAGIENILPSLCKSTYTNYKYLKKGLSTLGQQVSHSVKNTYKSMSCQSADNIVGSSGSIQQQEAYNNATDDSVRHNLDIQNNAVATKTQSIVRGNTVRKAFQKLDNWVNEVPDEREVRRRVKNQIKIDNGQLVVEGNLNLSSTNISSLPQGLHVGGNLILAYTSLTTLPQGLTGKIPYLNLPHRFSKIHCPPPCSYTAMSKAI